MPNSEIAAELFVSINTVKTHAASIYRKLGVTGRRDAVRRAEELGLFSTPPSGPGPAGRPRPRRARHRTHSAEMMRPGLRRTTVGPHRARRRPSSWRWGPHMDHAGKDFEFRIAGETLPVQLLDTVTTMDEMPRRTSTVFVCRLEDNAQLPGPVARITALGLEVMDMRRVPPEPALP